MVKLRCGEETTARVGRPPKKNTKAGYTNGWFMVLDPETREVLSANQTKQPENQELVFSSIEKVIGTYENATMLIYDRACKAKSAGLKRRRPRQIKTYAVDKFHAFKNHNDKCECSPYNHPWIMRKLSGLNTSLCCGGSIR